MTLKSNKNLKTKKEPGSPKKLTQKQVLRLAEATATHDGFFKCMVADLKRTCGILKWLLPKNGAAEIDWSQLKQQQKSFLDKNLRTSYADAVFEAPAKITTPDGTKAEVPCYLFFIFEHKSANSFKTVFQIIRYIVRIWERDHKQHGDKDNRFLPFVFPIIFYNGSAPYTSPENLGSIVAPIPGFEDYIPHWKTLVVNIRTIASEEFPKDGNADLFLEMMKSVTTSDGNQQISRILERMKDSHKSNTLLSENDFYSLMFYLYQKSRNINHKLMEEQMVQAAAVFDDSKVMSVFERKCARIQKEGIKRGIERGIEKGIERGIERGIEKGRLEGEIQGLIRLVEFVLGKPDTELTSLILGIQSRSIIENCYNALAIRKVKNSDDLKAVIRKG